MRKMLPVLLTALLVLSACSAKPSTSTLKVFNWGVYIDDAVIAEFEEKYDAKVVYDNFESNEAMYTKLQGGEKYDVLVPSDYMIERLIDEDKLQKLDFSKIPNYEGIIETLKGLPSDPTNEYSVPYFWGNVGLLYNTETVDLADLEEQGWNILINTKYAGKVFIYDSERDAFMIAYKALGYSANSTVPAQTEAAYQWLRKLNSTMDPAYVTDDVIDNMIEGVKDIAVMYSGDAAYIVTENESMAYFVPREGTNLWVDSMVIPSDAQNPDLAHKWINFMLEKEVALMNTVYVGYTTPVQEVFDEVTGEGGDYEGIEAYIPRTGDEHDETFRYDEDLKRILSDLWTKVKAQ
ncbi:MAG: ABC transporter substrate-binding protein [Firmicutes bacterium GWF2_51_9]|nr:MAG: ABC transporter substrate-binding protein [Firmicutes bacterium GWF2_51_9]OGS59192.1 MAG: ABC transporter substrate-binding protein [Firmicutes bacterium GWE2_51_13]HAM64123.1 ABC transporter substrate-binding protein [Erysipelotrichaceae bacterium]HBZ41755.1 ABC transporter substrate-binding protein [Erysipelotrichaceae bacterium]